MRNLEAIENDLTAAREALLSVEGMPAEVYSRIVGYYRSVRNWNRGKREEYGERRLYSVNSKPKYRNTNELVQSVCPAASPSSSVQELNLLLFVRASCPGCPPAKTAAAKLGFPVNLVNADTEEGFEEARKWNVLSTPMAILLSPDGNELGRAKDAEGIGRLPVHV